MMYNSPTYMEVKEEIRHQLRESAVVLLTQGPEKFHLWWGRKPLVRIVRRQLVAAVKTGKLEGPAHTRYYITTNISPDFAKVCCFILDRQKISEYDVMWKETTESGEAERREKASTLCSFTNSLWVGARSDCIKSVQFDDVTRIDGPGSLFDSPTFEVTF